MVDVVTWAESTWIVPESRELIELRPWQKAFLLAAFPADGSPSRWETFLISTVKKAGKTASSALAVYFAALTRPGPELIFAVANDAEQAESRVFERVAWQLRHNGMVASGEATVTKDTITFAATGTRIQAIPADFAGVAGAVFGVSSFTELWAYRHEGHTRLFEELTPVPGSLRFLDSYAGFEGDAPVLAPLWERALAGERLHDELPIFSNGRLWAFIDQGEDAQLRGWLGDPAEMDGYYAEQRASLRPGTFARLHLNQWQSGEEIFVTAETYDGCVSPDLRPVVSDPHLEVFVGVDAATRRDCAAVAAVARVLDGERVSYRLVRHRIWTVARGATLDLEETVESFVLELARLFRVRLVHYDPFQMVRSAQTLSKAGVRMEEYNQTSGNLTLAGQNLYDLLNARQLELYPDAELRRHFLNAVAVYSGRGWRLAKEKTSNKIDGCVATSFAALAAVEQPVVSSGAPWVARRESPRRLDDAEVAPSTGGGVTQIQPVDLSGAAIVNPDADREPRGPAFTRRRASRWKV